MVDQVYQITIDRSDIIDQVYQIRIDRSGIIDQVYQIRIDRSGIMDQVYHTRISFHHSAFILISHKELDGVVVSQVKIISNSTIATKIFCHLVCVVSLLITNKNKCAKKCNVPTMLLQLYQQGLHVSTLRWISYAIFH